MRFREQLDDLHEDICLELNEATKNLIERRLSEAKEGRVLTTQEMKKRLRGHREALYKQEIDRDVLTLIKNFPDSDTFDLVKRLKKLGAYQNYKDQTLQVYVSASLKRLLKAGKLMTKGWARQYKVVP